jgi:hypothetical protein
MPRRYEVGYGKPPERSRFRKGRSGNPRGRPKQPLDFQSQVIAELRSTLSIVEGGKKRKIQKLEAFCRAIVVRAIQGDKSMTRLLMDFIRKLPPQAFEGSEEARAQREAEKTLKEFLEEAAEYEFVEKVAKSDQEKAAAFDQEKDVALDNQGDT